MGMQFRDRRGKLVGKKASRILVADIGGTNARFAAASVERGRDGEHVEIDGFTVVASEDFKDPLELIQHYLSDAAPAPFDAACFAVAGPVQGRTAYLTNLGWSMEADAVEAELGLTNVCIANDFAALARSACAVDADKLLTLHPSDKADKEAPVSVMGPGTGFGCAQVVEMDGRVRVLPTEAGHASFVPHGDLETRVFDEVRDSMGRVTIETFMSGIGILRIYRAMCSLNDVVALNYEPSTISQRALEHNDPICVDTLSVFCSMLGGVAGDIALTQGSLGGVYLGGGILPKISKFLVNSDLVARYLDKPPLEDYVSRVPLKLILDPEAALIGAGLLAADMLRDS